MKEIRSKDNQIFKTCGKLLTKKYRDLLGCYLIEGEKLVKEAFTSDQKIDQVVLSEKYNRALDFPLDKAVVMDSKLFQKLSQTETSQGIIAIVRKNKFSTAVFLNKVGKGNIIVLDRLQDPGNIGTIIRTADAAGYGGVVILPGTGDVFSPKVVRAAAGSLFRIPILAADCPEEAVSLLKEGGKTIIATCFDTDNYYYDISMKENVALIIGNEGRGFSADLIEQSDIKVKIPMASTIDSLNASVAAGILMYEAMRK